MSYILEALKKAQAERQIGNTPTIHAPTLASMPAGQGARSKRTPVIVAMVLMATAIAGLAAMLLRQPQTGSQPSAVASQPSAAASEAPVIAGQAPAIDGQAPAIASHAPAAGQQRPATAPANAAPAQTAPMQTTPMQAASAARNDSGQHAAADPVVQAAARERVAAQSSAPMLDAPKPPATAGAAKPRRSDANAQAAALAAATQATAPAAVPAPAAIPAPAPVEEQVQSLRELPEPIQRAIPQITLGGYMYSKNPADRLLLIDKVLRREGEEVAPGLVLEKLLPKQAIFGFRGYRYRVAL